MMKRIVLCSTLLASIAAFAGNFNDNFSSLDPLWIPDRYAPAGFNSSWFDGDNRLAVTVSANDSMANRPATYSSSFYNTQGRQRSADVVGTWWSITAQTYVGADALSGNGLRRTDLWGSTGLTGSEVGSDYFIIGYYHMDLNDPMNPNAANITSGWRVWNDTTGWVYIGSPLTLGWHGLGIYYDAASNLATYTIDGISVYTMTPGGTYANHLRTTSVEAYNFGQGYTVYWDNVQVDSPVLVPVPEPTSWSFAILGIALCVLMQRGRCPAK